MKRDYSNIKNLDDLHLEVQRLKADYKFRGITLKQDARTYVQQFSPMNLIKRFTRPKTLLKLDEQTHSVSSLFSMLLPLVLNNTLFKRSGFITKTVAGLVSRRLGKSLDGQHLSGLIDAVKSIFKSKKEKRKTPAFVDYGIPPDSETY